MKINITKQILEAMNKTLEKESLTIPQLAQAIDMSRTSLWRIFNEQSMTMDSAVYHRLQSEYLYRHLKFDDYVFIEDINPDEVRKSQNIFLHRKLITQLQWQLGISDRQLRDTTHDMLLAQNEIKELESKLNRINKLSEC